MALGRGAKYLNGRDCFYAWLSQGSSEKATDFLTLRGIRNPSTGEPPTRMGVWSSAVRYAAEHMDECYLAIQHSVEEQGGDPGSFTWEGFVEWLIKSARTAYSSERAFAYFVYLHDLQKYLPPAQRSRYESAYGEYLPQPQAS